MVVVGKLMKLTYSGIMYAIEKFKEQMNLDIANQVQHDMYHWNPPTDE